MYGNVEQSKKVVVGTEAVNSILEYSTNFRNCFSDEVFKILPS